MAEEIIFDEAFLRQLASLNMALSLRLHEGMQGGRRSMAKGASLEFSDFREYGPGDDFRRIDWAAYGRLDKLFVKEFMEEKEALFHIFLDRSQSMAYGTPAKGKTSLKIIAALSYIIMGHLDRVRIRILGSTDPNRGTVPEVGTDPNRKTVPEVDTNPNVRTVPEVNTVTKQQGTMTIESGTGKQGFYQLIEQLEGVQFGGNSNIGAALLHEPIRTKGVSVVISDFLFEKGLEQMEKALAYLKYKKQHIILVQVLCKEERSPEEMGDFEFIDSESQKTVRLTLNPKTIEAYKKRLETYQNELEALALKYGASFVQVNTEHSIEDIILKEFYRKQIIF